MTLPARISALARAIAPASVTGAVPPAIGMEAMHTGWPAGMNSRNTAKPSSVNCSGLIGVWNPSQNRQARFLNAPQFGVTENAESTSTHSFHIVRVHAAPRR